ncbi:hypothetical protein STEG23_016206 [Scotinomys teguina]
MLHLKLEFSSNPPLTDNGQSEFELISENTLACHTIGDVAKKLGEMWNNTAADDKQPYEKKAAKLKEK